MATQIEELYSRIHAFAGDGAELRLPPRERLTKESFIDGEPTGRLLRPPPGAKEFVITTRHIAGNPIIFRPDLIEVIAQLPPQVCNTDGELWISTTSAGFSSDSQYHLGKTRVIVVAPD